MLTPCDVPGFGASVPASTGTCAALSCATVCSAYFSLSAVGNLGNDRLRFVMLSLLRYGDRLGSVVSESPLAIPLTPSSTVSVGTTNAWCDATKVAKSGAGTLSANK